MDLFALFAEGVWDGALRGAIIGGAVGACVGLVMYFVKKNKGDS